MHKMIKYPGRITKQAARKRWNEGKSFIITPRYISPFYPDGRLNNEGVFVNEDVRKNYKNFDFFCDEFTFYNCNKVTGPYPAYYVLNTERS